MILYTVKNGDTLGAIAAKHGVGVNNILRLQPVAISNKNLIMPGDIITFTANPKPLEDILYMVIAGDTLGAIAKRYGVTVADIQKRNNIVNPNKIFPGQLLSIK